MNPNNGGCGEMNSRGARRWWALAAITLGVLAVGLDVTVLSVALPTLAVALKASESDLHRFSSGYPLPLAPAIGPIFGGWLLTNFWWGWIFLMNVPVAAIGLLAVLTLVPESRASQRPAIDPAGMVLASGGLAGVTYGLIELGRNGWTDPA